MEKTYDIRQDTFYYHTDKLYKWKFFLFLVDPSTVKVRIKLRLLADNPVTCFYITKSLLMIIFYTYAFYTRYILSLQSVYKIFLNKE